MKRFVALIIAALASLALLILQIGWIRSEPQSIALQGEIEMARVDVSSKVAGRLLTVHVRKGDRVEAGDPLVELDGPELQARLFQAESARSAADAQRRKSEAGSRKQELDAARAQWQKAAAALELAERTFGRIENLYSEGVVPRQRLDEVETQLAISRADEGMARAQLEIAEEGAREEDRDAAAALERQAHGSVMEVESFIKETLLRAPLDALVDDIVLRVGELAASGMPLVTLLDTTDVWIVFQITEDRLHSVSEGSPIKVQIPAKGSVDYVAQISYISVLPHFATWRATRSSGGFDVRTFEVHARLSEPVTGLRPGMSVLWNPEK